MGKRVYIEYTGCPTGLFEYRIIRKIVEDSGYEISDNPDNADVIILNMCVIKGPSESKAMRRLRRFVGRKKVIVSGCFGEYKGRELFDRYGVNVVGVNSLERIPDAIEKDGIILIGGERILKCKYEWKFSVVEPLLIEEGCEFNCSYCVDKIIRGKLFSYPKEIILKRFRRMIENGVKEIWITGQECGAWGRDFGEKFPNLMREILKIEGEYRIRIGMMNPVYAKIYLEDLIQIFMDERVYKFLHIPIQSGSNRILKLMGRGYTVEEFLEMVDEYRRGIPKISIATDVIVGFPTETEEEFWETVDVIRKIRPDFLNISRFWPREGTKASKMKMLPGYETKRRSRIITREYEKISLERNKEWVGWVGKVLVDEIGKGAFISRNDYYKPIVIREDVRLGEFYKVKVKGAKVYFLEGKVLN